MPYKTFNNGDVLTAADVNDYLMEQAVITCTSGTRPSSPVEGMTIYETDTDAIRTYSGSAWTVVHYLAKPMAILRQTVSQNFTHSNWTAFTFTTEDLDNRNGHSTSSNTSRYVAPVAGWYELSGAGCWATTSSGTLWTRWAKNGTEIVGSASNMVNTTSQALLPARTILVSLAASDYVELQGVQFSGSTLATYVSDAYAQSTMTVKWVAPS